MEVGRQICGALFRSHEPSYALRNSIQLIALDSLSLLWFVASAQVDARGRVFGGTIDATGLFGFCVGALASSLTHTQFRIFNPRTLTHMHTAYSSLCMRWK